MWSFWLIVLLGRWYCWYMALTHWHHLHPDSIVIKPSRKSLQNLFVEHKTAKLLGNTTRKKTLQQKTLSATTKIQNVKTVRHDTMEIHIIYHNLIIKSIIMYTATLQHANIIQHCTTKKPGSNSQTRQLPNNYSDQPMDYYRRTMRSS